MDLSFELTCNVETLTNVVAAGGLTRSRFFGVSCDEDSNKTVVHVADDITSDELAIVNNIVASYDTLADLKTRRCDELHTDCTSFIYSHYDQARQASLNALLTEAAVMGYTNRIQYIGGALTWIKAVISYYYELQDTINNQSTAKDVNDVIWNFAENFGNNDPGVALREASNLNN